MNPPDNGTRVVNIPGKINWCEWPRIVRKYNPRGALLWIVSAAATGLRRVPWLGQQLARFRRGILQRQAQLEFESFDAHHATDTGKVIELSELTLTQPASAAEGIRYEGVSPKMFRQMMDAIRTPPPSFDFIDYGSGKGRVLLMAAERGFRTIIGVDFARELYEIAERNIEIFNRTRTSPAHFELHHIDAVEYQPPDTPLIIFFYCPFRGTVLDRVLANIMNSYRRQPRAMVLLFYGQNPTVIRQFRSMALNEREIRMHRDFDCFRHYRGLIFYTDEARPYLRSGHEGQPPQSKKTLG